MKIEIIKDIFLENPDNSEIDRLWALIGFQHTLCLKDEEDINALMESSWYSGLRKLSQNIIYDFILLSLQSDPIPKSDVIISNGLGDEYFSLKESIRYLSQPFILLLENSNNDSPFFEALLRNFPEESEVILKHKREGLFKYGMGGGSTIKDVILAEEKSFDKEYFPKEPWRYLRFFVLVDSDKEYAGMPLTKTKLDLVDFLESKKIKYHVFHKREMENYLPEEAYDGIVHNREYIEAYLRLDAIQKDFLDIEKGFNQKKFDKLDISIQNFFSDISNGDKDIFRNNTLKRIHGSEKENFKTEFPKLFMAENVTKETLLKRCSHHDGGLHLELPNLLKSISVLL